MILFDYESEEELYQSYEANISSAMAEYQHTLLEARREWRAAIGVIKRSFQAKARQQFGKDLQDIIDSCQST